MRNQFFVEKNWTLYMFKCFLHLSLEYFHSTNCDTPDMIARVRKFRKLLLIRKENIGNESFSALSLIRIFLLIRDSTNVFSDLAYATFDRNVHERACASGVENLLRFCRLTFTRKEYRTVWTLKSAVNVKSSVKYLLRRHRLN